MRQARATTGCVRWPPHKEMFLEDFSEMDLDLFRRASLATSNMLREKGRGTEKKKKYEFGGRSAVQWKFCIATIKLWRDTTTLGTPYHLSIPMGKK